MSVAPCWEFLNCGKEADCPAHPDHGKKCWEVEGTLCRGERQGNYEQKIGACRTNCAYYKKVIMGK